MKTKKFLKDIREKNINELDAELLELYKASFGLRIQNSSGQLSKTSEIKKIKKDIARVKTVRAEKKVG